ncbi:hypothetical protein CVIRNUC_010998 [Coccomyxa viridis]|uniref:starch synthase n=1 Tax=Coccomyxa viridis TaxID=1274662 RepID=A0AAV1IMC0_9CHLO|nr:hypothetical protein CVIRNUC_010998 [Coccomyxa viridis]
MVPLELPGSCRVHMATHMHAPGSIPGARMTKYPHLRKELPRSVCRAAAETESKPGVSSDGVEPRLQRTDSGREARQAVAAKISAARALARKLSEEKQAAMSAARLAADEAMNEEEIDRIRQSVEVASANAAKEVARADALARAAQRAKSFGPGMKELERLKAENGALQGLVVDLAANKAEAKKRLEDLREKYQHLLQAGVQLTASVTDSTDAEAEATLAELRSTAQRSDQEVVNVMTALSVAKEALQRKAVSAQPQALAQKAMEQGRAIFTIPEGGIPVGSRGTLFYNTAASPLPGSAAPQLRVGVNRWETQVTLDMQRAQGLELPASDWWCAELEFDEDTFQVDFVVMDCKSGVFDNKGGQDYSLPLLGASTEPEILDRRAAVYEAAERERLVETEAEEERLWKEQVEAAKSHAGAAGEKYRRDREEEMQREAQAIVAERRGPEISALTTESRREGVFAWAGGQPRAGQRALLAYNKACAALRHARDVVVHVSHDAWVEEEKEDVPMRPLSQKEVSEHGLREGCEWWGAQLDVLPYALVLDFVFSDSALQAWDNNGQQDFHTSIAGAMTDEEYVRELYSAMLEDARQELQEGMQRAAQRCAQKAELKAAALRRRRAMQRQVLYTKPVTAEAGKPVQVYYNPDSTVLRGRPETWLRGGWNRWAHPRAISPQRMQPVLPGGTGFLQATVQVPKDAWSMDIVFGDSGDLAGGFYDSNAGVDYHVPVAGSSARPPCLRIAHVSVEMAPIAKVGGMGDVVTALARAVQDEGHEVEVVLPKYDIINYAEVRNLRPRGDFFFSNVQVKVWVGEVEDIKTTFLEPTSGIFWVKCIYGRNDDAGRFAFFCGAATEYLKHHCKQMPDIVHAHDWPTAPVAFGDLGGRCRSIFTIHNLNYGADLIGRAMLAAAAGTTVSPTYAAEVSGHPAVAPHMTKFYGIRNGIDQDIWDPLEDRFLPRNYGVEDAAAGKAAAKAELRRRMELSSADVPLVAVITRLTHQKGIHLIKHAAWRALERGAQFVLLGSAPDPRVQNEFNGMAADMARQYMDRARCCFSYDEPLSHLIYAGADMLLVPSIFEPCGLTQMIAMRYGTVPVVRKTGGLNDTVFDVDDDEERASSQGMVTNGYNFEGTDAGGVDYALNRALAAWNADKQGWADLVERIMEQDWSWSEPALDYIELYYKAIKGCDV